MSIHTFWAYMQLRYMELNPSVLDDELPDRVDDWLADMPAEEVYRYTEAWIEARRVERAKVGALNANKGAYRKGKR